MSIFRAAFAVFMLTFGVSLPVFADVSAIDILGREITLPAPAQRIVLGEGRHMAVLGILHDDPVALVTGWRLDKALDTATMKAYRAKFSKIDDIRPVGAGNRELSTESVIALAPDLVVLSLMDASDPGTKAAQERIEAAGIPVAYVDFFSHPQENSIPSLRILGALTGAEPRAEEFASFYTTHLNKIRDLLTDPSIVRPDVFFHVHAAPKNCCSTVGGGVFRDFIETAGGHNIGSDVVPGVLGNVSLEFLIGSNPDFYIATGGTHMMARGGLVVGAGVDTPTAQDSLATLLATPGFSSLRAISEGHVAGVWHLFNDSPSHIALIEYLAKTFHPTLFADLDPDATMAEIESRFSPVTVPGTWWVTP